MSSTDRQRWAHVPPHLAWKHPELPTEWTRVLERNPDAMNPEPLPGYGEGRWELFQKRRP